LGFGVQVGRQGYLPYIMGGAISPGKGASVTYSENDTEHNSTTINLAGSYMGAFNVSYPFTKEPVRFSSGEASYGLGFPGGVSATVNRTFDFNKW
jgi:hypothetical protein